MGLTNVGENIATDLWDGTISAPTNWYAASGTNATAFAKGNTALGVEVATRVITTDTQPTSDTNRQVATIPYTSSLTITEAGLFDAASVGNMPIRETFAGIGVTNGDSIEFTFDTATS